MIDIAQLVCRDRGRPHRFCQLIHLLLRNLLVVDHNRIVEVTSFDQVIIQKCLYLSHKYKGTGRGDLLRIGGKVVQTGKLIGEHLRIKSDQHMEAKGIVGEEGQL